MDAPTAKFHYICATSQRSYINFASDRIIPSHCFAKLYYAAHHALSQFAYDAPIAEARNLSIAHDVTESDEEDDSAEHLIVREGYIGWPSNSRIRLEIKLSEDCTVWVWEDEERQQYMDHDTEWTQHRARTAALPTLQEV